MTLSLDEDQQCTSEMLQSKSYKQLYFSFKGTLSGRLTDHLCKEIDKTISVRLLMCLHQRQLVGHSNCIHFHTWVITVLKLIETLQLFPMKEHC